MAVSTKVIRSVFTNVLFVIGVVLMVVGFISGVSTGVNLVVFEEYPLRYGEDRCVYAQPLPVVEKSVDDENAKSNELQRQQQICIDNLEKQREIELVEDITRSIGFLVSGGAMVYVFRKRA